jgi:hypothetical protein
MNKGSHRAIILPSVVDNNCAENASHGASYKTHGQYNVTAWQALGMDTHSLFGVGSAIGFDRQTYQLADSSPCVLKAGFKNIDTHFGVLYPPTDHEPLIHTTDSSAGAARSAGEHGAGTARLIGTGGLIGSRAPPLFEPIFDVRLSRCHNASEGQSWRFEEASGTIQLAGGGPRACLATESIDVQDAMSLAVFDCSATHMGMMRWRRVPVNLERQPKYTLEQGRDNGRHSPTANATAVRTARARDCHRLCQESVGSSCESYTWYHPQHPLVSSNRPPDHSSFNSSHVGIELDGLCWLHDATHPWRPTQALGVTSGRRLHTPTRVPAVESYNVQLVYGTSSGDDLLFCLDAYDEQGVSNVRLVECAKTSHVWQLQQGAGGAVLLHAPYARGSQCVDACKRECMVPPPV